MTQIESPTNIIHGVLREVFDFLNLHSKTPIQIPMNETSTLTCNYEMLDLGIRSYGLKGS